MTAIVLIPALAVATALAIGAYLRFATTSAAGSAKIWTIVEDHAGRLLTDKYPPVIREMALGLGMSAGCGCYVRSFLIVHYAPWLMSLFPRGGHAGSKHAEFSDALASLSSQQRQNVEKLIAAVIVFDSFANPLLGLLVRRVLLSMNARPEKARDLPPATKEAKVAALKALRTWKPQHELCAA